MKSASTAIASSAQAAPSVSIIITNYNYARYLRASIDSALAQTYPQVEVIVVDDGSTDGSREIIESYGTRIVPVIKANGGHRSAVHPRLGVKRGADRVFLAPP